MKLLIVEDEKRMSEAVCTILRQEKYDVDAYYDGVGGLEAARSNIYDLIILDVMLPGMNGFEIARNIRKEGIQTPVLMLTAKADTDDKVEGLDSGADDYLTKPFETKELLARIRAMLRRNNIQSTDDTGKLSAGDLKLDQGKSMLINTENGMDVRLSEKELHIIEIFMTNAGNIISKEQLAVKIWGYENEAEYNNVEVYISFTRKKIQYLDSKMEIKAVRGLGYELRQKETS
ncbi:MAG: response regulator transcription factor [Butyrivibrio sp.]|nr:response regulator transcription factor [Butyrivibrio sp.]MBQ6415527.1 response regulator transcription factor [Butyrivibrio sp.]